MSPLFLPHPATNKRVLLLVAQSARTALGLPLRREGWLAMICFFLGPLGGTPLLGLGPFFYAFYAVVLGLAFVGLCYWKGEKPGWRRGPRD